jgi:hypothetical protein
LKISADVDLADAEGKTPLHHAAYCYNETVNKVTDRLVELGAYTDACCHLGTTPLELACENQNFRAAKALISAGADSGKDLLAACVSIIRAKSSGGSVPDERVEEFKILQRDFISDLVHRKTLIDWHPSGEDGQTALTRAVCDGEESTVRLLLQLGANVNARDGNDRTALRNAVESCEGHCVKILIAAGADVNLVDQDRTPAIYCLPLFEIDGNVAGIWVSLITAGADIEKGHWYANYDTHASVFELAICQALQGAYFPLNLIMEHSPQVVLRSLETAKYDSHLFLQSFQEESRNLISGKDIEIESTLRSLQNSVKRHKHREAHLKLNAPSKRSCVEISRCDR